MSFRVVEGGSTGDGAGPRILAPGAPPSPGPCPPELAAQLEPGEVLVWWGDKSGIELALAGISLGAAAIALLLVTGFAPTFWTQPPALLWKPLLAVLSPTLVILGREWASRRAVLVTDHAIIDVPRRSPPRRLALAGIVRVRRDRLRGGLRIEGRHTVLHVPASLMQDAGQAVRSRARSRLQPPAPQADPLRWLS